MTGFIGIEPVLFEHINFFHMKTAGAYLAGGTKISHLTEPCAPFGAPSNGEFDPGSG